MTTDFNQRPFALILIALALAACASAEPAAADASATAPAIAVDLGSSARDPAPESMTRVALAEDRGRPRAAAASGEMQMAHAGHTHAQGTGTVNSVDASGHKINLTHGPIPVLGWPGMTMDFAVAPAVDLRTLKPGTRVNFTIEQGDGGNYEIQSVKPAGGGR
jgi:Cu(I)/Ag(I) efflux system protein CusF